jgi:hypothetical protein
MTGRRGDAGPFADIARTLARIKPTIVRWILGVAAALGVSAEVFEPLGNLLERSRFLGSSLLALVALVIFDAISHPPESTEGTGTHLLAEVEEIREHVTNAFKARDVRIDFSASLWNLW